MLAEGAHRGNDADRIHKTAMQQIPQQQQATQAQLLQLRDRIQSAGIGADPEAEEEYLALLSDRRKLEQLGAMNPVLTLVSTPPGADLQKALDYGALLLEVYGGGVLVKSAAGDLAVHVAKLRSLGDSPHGAIALELANDLEVLL
jgi:hypothetical protein